VATIHRDAGRTTEALDNATAAVAIADAAGNRVLEACARNALAVATHAAGRPAIEIYQQALRIARGIGARHEECKALIGLATVQLHCRRYDEATAYANHAIAIAADSGYRLLEGQGRTVLAAVHP
jgi:tetratricopeptide (TPR) repeat protein